MSPLLSAQDVRCDAMTTRGATCRRHADWRLTNEQHYCTYHAHEIDLWGFRTHWWTHLRTGVKVRMGTWSRDAARLHQSVHGGYRS